MSKVVHGEIEYKREDGLWVHSDICPKKCLWENMTEEHKQYLIDTLREWLDNSNGSGHFYIENEDYRNRMKNLLDSM